MTRLLTGDALAGETERLRERIAQFFSRLEAQLKQVLREAQIREGMKPSISAAALANLLLASWDVSAIREKRVSRVTTGKLGASVALSEQPLANAVFHRHQSCHRFRRLGAIFAAVPFHCRQMLRKHLVFCILQKVNDVLQTDNVGYLNAIGRSIS